MYMVVESVGNPRYWTKPLEGGVWLKDPFVPRKIGRLTSQVQVGSVWVPAFCTVKEVPPFKVMPITLPACVIVLQSAYSTKPEEFKNTVL